jgi:hypothetical protein
LFIFEKGKIQTQRDAVLYQHSFHSSKHLDEFLEKVRLELISEEHCGTILFKNLKNILTIKQDFQQICGFTLCKMGAFDPTLIIIF